MPSPKRPSFSGARVVVALGIGFLVGLCLVFFFQVIISHTPADIHDMRIRAISSSLAAIVIETTRQLQAGRATLLSPPLVEPLSLLHHLAPGRAEISCQPSCAACLAIHLSDGA